MNRVVEVRICYEWKPDKCKHYRGMRHKTKECRKKMSRKKQWVIKKKDNKKHLLKKGKMLKNSNWWTRGWSIRRKRRRTIRALSSPTLSRSLIVMKREKAPKKMNKMTIEDGREEPLFKMDRIASWNVWGINNPMKQKEFKNMNLSNMVGMIGLLETRVKAENLGTLYQNLFARWCFNTNISLHDERG